jgi:hypothetical protein
MPRFLAIVSVFVLGCSSGSIELQDEDGSVEEIIDPGGDDAGVAGDDAGIAGDDAGIAGDDAGSSSDSVQTYSCQNPNPSWRLCEDFERGNGDFDAWLALSDFIGGVGQDDRGRITLDSGQVHGGNWAVYMPAAAGSGCQGASLDWRDCVGAQETNCSMYSHEVLYFRAWIRFAPDHRYVHHFLNIGGSQPDDYWYHGTAGCLPNGVTSMGTTVDFSENTHESFFYTYWPEMSCDTRCDRYADVNQICQDCADKGFPTCDQQPQCCWGNHFSPDPPVAFPVGEWFCFEMTMQANTVGERDGGSTTCWPCGWTRAAPLPSGGAPVRRLHSTGCGCNTTSPRMMLRASPTGCGSTTWW